MYHPFPADELIWATAATQNAVSWGHIDGNGAATVVTVITGSKYWVLSCPKTAKAGSGKKKPNGNMASIRAFGVGWSPSSACEHLWDHEGILLQAGDVLYATCFTFLHQFNVEVLANRYMRPSTHHYVLTVDNSIIHGRHMYPACVSQMSAFGIVHCFVMGHAVTNVTTHEKMLICLRRNMAMWVDKYLQDPDFLPGSDPHIPNIATMDGLLDIMAIGNLLELGAVLHPSSYTTSGFNDDSDMGAARAMYRRLQLHFALNYVTTVNKVTICPHSIFRRYLVEFAAALVVYKEDSYMEAPKTRGCTPARVKGKVESFFSKNYPELQPKLLTLIKARHEWLCWTGPTINIKHRNDLDNVFLPSQLDFIDCPLYDREEEEEDELKSNGGDNDGDGGVEHAKDPTAATSGTVGQQQSRAVMDGPTTRSKRSREMDVGSPPRSSNRRRHQ